MLIQPFNSQNSWKRFWNHLRQIFKNKDWEGGPRPALPRTHNCLEPAPVWIDLQQIACHQSKSIIQCIFKMLRRSSKWWWGQLRKFFYRIGKISSQRCQGAKYFSVTNWYSCQLRTENTAIRIITTMAVIRRLPKLDKPGGLIGWNLFCSGIRWIDSNSGVEVAWGSRSRPWAPGLWGTKSTFAPRSLRFCAIFSPFLTAIFLLRTHGVILIFWANFSAGTFYTILER